MACIPPNPRRVGYIVPIHGPLDGPLYMGSKYSNTPRSLNYRRRGVQDWTTRKLTPPQSELPTQQCSRLDKKKIQRAKTPPQPQLATCYVETGAKLREGRGGQSLGEDVSKLGGGRDMEYPNIAGGDSVAHEV